MMRTRWTPCFLLVVFAAASASGEVGFATRPAAARVGDRVNIAFAVTAPTDVEVAVLDAKGRVVRHLAAGVLGAKNPPPAPLRPGLSQSLVWDGKDDFGRAAVGGPFQVRVRAGTGVRFGRFVGGDPCTFGSIAGIAADEDGNVYVLGFGGLVGQGHMTLRQFDPQGRYLREILPFPADLPPGAMKDVARWDPVRKTFFVRNHSGLNPRWYHSDCLRLVGASKKSGIVFTDGTRLYALNLDGSVRGAKFAIRVMWPKKLMPWGAVRNTGKGPVHLAVSPDGKWAYLSGIFSSKTRYGHKFLPALPPGRVYRMPLDAPGLMKEFVTVPVAHKEGQGGKYVKGMGYGFGPKSAVQGVSVDARGRVYVCNREHAKISVFDPSGKEIGGVPVQYPDQVAVHPETGAIYVMQKDRIAYSKWYSKLLKFDGIGATEPSAAFPFGPKVSRPRMALSVGKDKTVIWVAGVEGGLVALEDKGGRFVPMPTQYRPVPGAQLDWNRLAVDFARDEVYVSDGATKVWRYDGSTGRGGVLRKNGKPFLVNDLAVGYDGLLYVRVSNAQIGKGSPYSGPFWRLDRDLNPAPYKATGTHVLSPYIYSRYGIGYAERGIGVGPDGTVYLSWMYAGWVKYAVTGFGPDGRPLRGKYLVGKCHESNYKQGTPKSLQSAIIGPIPAANGGLRVDLRGNIYLGLRVWPRGLPFPRGFEKSRPYYHAVGSVVRFTPEGGEVLRLGKKNPSAALEGRPMLHGELIKGATAVYPGFAPFSRSPFGTTCCVCRTPRFDLDRYGRLALPNAITHSVRLLDNAGNLILEFGKYGNFDSQYVNPNLQENGKPPKVTVAVPAIPLGWPTGAGFGRGHIYVNDTRNRRVVRVDVTYSAEETCGIK